MAYKIANLCKAVDGIQACLRARNVAHAKSKSENRKKAMQMLQNEIDKKEEEKKEDEQDLESGDAQAAKESAKEESDVIVKKKQAGSDAGKSMNAHELAELENFKKMAASVDLVNRRPPPKASASAKSGSGLEEGAMEVKDEPDDDDDDVEIQFDSDRPANI